MKHISIIRTFSGALAALAVMTSVRALPATVTESVDTVYSGVPVTEHVGGYDHYERDLITRTYDFSADDIGYYLSDPAISVSDSSAAVITDGRLAVKTGKRFVFGSSVCLGDDYGLEEGYLSFDLRYRSGGFSLGLRTSKTDADTADRGIWFTFDGTDRLTFSEPESGVFGKIDMAASVSDQAKISVHEQLDRITLSVNGRTAAIVKYDKDGYLAFCDSDGYVVEKTENSKIYPTGYFSLFFDDLDGSVDDVVFTNVEMKRNVPLTSEPRVIDYSTWTATDALDRTVADNANAGDVKENRYVGLFYFLCCTGRGIKVNDNTADYLKYGSDGIKAHIEARGGEAYWAEPYFGYYRNTDAWVYRKHGYMLEQAGVDFIFLDVSNGEVFIPGHMTLFDTWLQMRKEGNQTPQIVFFNGDTAEYMQSNMETLLTTVYSDENWDKYKELFFMWEEKPLLFGNMNGVSDPIKTEINERFNVRGSWAWIDKNSYWSWIQEYVKSGTRYKLENGGWGRDSNGQKESLSIAMGHHPTANKGRSFVNRVQPNNGLGDFEFSSIEQSGMGLGFEHQFNAAQYLIKRNIGNSDPFVLMITGWNEWISGGINTDTAKMMANTTCKVQYTDQFNPEFSRDGEPMRNKDGYGFGDNYYYQMVDYIRRYKGIAKTPIADDQTSINIYDLSSWDNIDLKYTDSLYDTELRNTVCYDASYRYINNTGRNDFDYAKVSQDNNSLYFLVKTSHDIVIDNGETWMNLYLNTDGDVKTGWEGYDYVLNRSRDSFSVNVERFKDDTFSTEYVGTAYYYLNGEYMTVSLSKKLVGISGEARKLIFKWADNADVKGDAMGFMDQGDTAPDNRFGFLYICDGYTTTELPEIKFSAEPFETLRNGNAISPPDTDIKTEVKNESIELSYGFNEFSPGTELENTELSKYFEYVSGTGNSLAQITDANGSGCAYINGYSDLRTWNLIKGNYELSADLWCSEYESGGIFIRGELPGAYKPVNALNGGIDQIFNYFEADWYSENGGSMYEKTSLAGSGIGFLPSQNGIFVKIKRYAEDGLNISSASYLLPYTNDFVPDANGWIDLRFVDDNSTVSVYSGQTLICTLRLENPGTVYATDGTDQQYFGRVTLVDGYGTELLTVDKTRVNSEGSQIAFTSRNSVLRIDNLNLSYSTVQLLGTYNAVSLNNINEKLFYIPNDISLFPKAAEIEDIDIQSDRVLIRFDRYIASDSLSDIEFTDIFGNISVHHVLYDRSAINSDGKYCGKVFSFRFRHQTPIASFSIPDSVTDHVGNRIVAYHYDITGSNVKTGDVYTDGVVNTKDIVTLKLYLKNNGIHINETAADADGDGRITFYDLNIIADIVE